MRNEILSSITSFDHNDLPVITLFKSETQPSGLQSLLYLFIHLHMERIPFRIMPLLRRFRLVFIDVRVAIHAPVRTGVVCPNIDALCAGTFLSCCGPSSVDRCSRYLSQINSVDAACLLHFFRLQIIIATGIKLNAVGFSPLRQTMSVLPFPIH